MSKKFGDLTQLTTPATNDILPVDDVSAGSTKKITIADLVNTPSNIGFAALASTVFSGQVQSQTNAGTAGGTIYWINLGGIKIMWALGVSQTVGTGGASFTFTLPSFFTTIQSILESAAGVSISANQYHNIDHYSTSSVTFNMRSDTNGSTQTPSIFIIGT